MPKNQQSETRRRTWSYRLLMVVFAVALTLSTLAVWANTRIQDSDDWAAMVGPLADEPAVREYIVSQASEIIDRQIGVDEDAGMLTSYTRAQLSGVANIALQEFVSSPSFTDWWTSANRAAHTFIWQTFNGDEGTQFRYSGDEILLDLQPAVDWTNQQLQSLFPSSQYIISLPPEQTLITLYASESLQEVAKIINLIARLAVYLPILALAALIGVLIAARSRLNAILQIGLVIATSMVALILIFSFARMWIVSHQPETNQDVLDAVFRVVLQDLMATFRVLAAVGLLLIARVIIVKWVQANWQTIRSVAERNRVAIAATTLALAVLFLISTRYPPAWLILASLVVILISGSLLLNWRRLPAPTGDRPR